MSPATAYSDPTPALRAERGGLAPTAPAKMNLYDLQNMFWQLDANERFSGTETRLYFYWLNRFNAEFWPAELTRWGKQVEADLGLTDKTLAAARVGLVRRGLLTYTEGTRIRAAVWALPGIIPDDMNRNNSGPQPINRNNSGQSAGIPPSEARNNSGRNEGIPPIESRNFSGLTNKTKTDVEDKDSTTPFSRGDAAQGPEVFVEVTQELPAAEDETPAPAPKKKVAAKKKAPARASRPEVPFGESELAGYEAFAAAFEGTDYELADLRYYHEKIKNWRQKGEAPRRKDWLATAKQFFLNDAHDNRLKLAPGVQHAASHAEPVGSGAGATGYRASRWD